MDIQLLTRKQKLYIKGKTGGDLCISCLKPFSHYHQEYIRIDSEELNHDLGAEEYLVEFFICGQCYRSKFKDRMKFILQMEELRIKTIEKTNDKNWYI